MKSTSLKQFMCNSEPKFKLIVLLFIALFIPLVGYSSSELEFDEKTVRWDEYSKEVHKLESRDARNGISYIISGSLALAGGIWGSSIVDDNIEKGIYTVFQTIGIASVGYGAYIWQIGDEERNLYHTLNSVRLTPEQKTLFLKSYYAQKKEFEKKERYIKAVTHGLIAGLNFYNASQQKQSSIKNGLNFIAGVNLLAAISFTFDF